MPKLPNVLLITADQHRCDAMSAAASVTPHRPSVLRTPNLDRLGSDDWTYIVHENGGFTELYDLHADPDECRNLGSDASTQPGKKDSRRAWRAGWRRSALLACSTVQAIS